MSIGLKIMCVIIAATLLLSLVILAFSKITFSRSFAALETNHTTANVVRIVSAYDNMLKDLDRLNHDWAAWDDSYNFVQSPNQAYIESNPTDTTFINAKLNYILFINNAGTIVYGKGFDLDQELETAIPSNILEQMTGSAILAHPYLSYSTSGIIQLPGNPLMFSAQPIVTSEGAGPVAGTLIMARYFEANVVDLLTETTHLAISLIDIPTHNDETDIQTAYSHLATNPVFVQPLNVETIAGYALINDIHGNPALIIQSEMPRDIYLQGQSTIKYYLLFLGIFSVLFIVTIMLLINRLVARRLRSLSRNVKLIQTTRNLSDRVKVSGDDELTSLGFSINEMLSTIQASQDLLEKKRREEEILRSTIESVADGLVIFDINGIIRQVNDAATKMQGYLSKEDMVGRSFRDFIAEDNQAEFGNLLESTLRSAFSGTVEFSSLKKDGSRFPVEMSAAILRGNSGQAIGIVAAIRDISERKRMEQALQEKEKQYRLLVENQSDLVVEMNPRGDLLFANPAYCKIAGMERDLLLGSSAISQVYSADHGQFLSILEKLNQPPHIAHSDHRLTVDQEMRWIAWTYNAVLDESNQITSITCSGRDVTEKKQAQEELVKANAQLKELDKMKDNLLSTVSHELRTPLTSIKSFTEILLTYDEDRETQKQFLGIISEESDRLTRLINDFLDLSKIQAGKMQWKTVELSIADVINSAVLTSRPLIEKAGLQLSLDIRQDIPHIMCDRDKLIQVLTNLVGNAIKFTREGGQITLKAWTGQGRNNHDPGWFTVSISDTGIGIAPENHHKIFDNFGQVGDVLKDRPKGTGLGLPICKKIVENFGGRIWVESDLGQGTTFLFCLPAATAKVNPGSPAGAPEISRAAAPRSLSDCRGKTILVVDDEANIRCFINHELTKRGYQVLEACGGRDALDLARKYRPDLITLDISMPDINGLDVTAVIKNDPATKNIPILIISVMEEQQRAFQLGADDYINKPISMDLLMQKVNLLLGTSQKNILIVDDDQALTQSLAYELKKRGFTIATAQGGKQALTYLEQNRPDLILLDLKMPGMDGFEVMETLKHKPAIAAIPVVILTGIDIDEGKSAALSVGATDYFNKSEGNGQLFAAIERILNGAVAPQDTASTIREKAVASLGS